MDSITSPLTGRIATLERIFFWSSIVCVILSLLCVAGCQTADGFGGLFYVFSMFFLILLAIICYVTARGLRNRGVWSARIATFLPAVLLALLLPSALMQAAQSLTFGYVVGVLLYVGELIVIFLLMWAYPRWVRTDQEMNTLVIGTTEKTNL